MAVISLKTSADTRGAKRFNDEIAKGEEELEKLTKAARGFAGQKRKFEEMADPLKRLNREWAQLALSHKKHGLSLGDAEKAAAKLQRRHDRLADSGKQAFGHNAVMQLASYARGFLGIAAAVSAATRALQENRLEREKAVAGSKSAVSGEASLAQLAVTMGGTEAERKAAHRALLAESRGAFAMGAFADRNEAGSQTFGLNSAGLAKADRDFAYRLRRSGAIENVGDAATAYSAMTKAMGLGEVGSFDDFMDKALQASALAPAQANEIPLAAARSAGSAKALGLSDEFITAGTALLAGIKGSAAEGGTMQAAFLKQVEIAAATHPELKGLSGVEIVKAIAAMPEDQQGFGGILGNRAEAIEGFRNLRDNLGVLERETAKIGGAQSANIAQQAINVAESDPNTLAAIYTRQKANQLELSNLDNATHEMLFQAAMDERRRVRRENNPGFMTELSLGVEGTQVFIETMGGLLDSAGYKDRIVKEMRRDGEIQDAGLEQAIRENTGAIRASNAGRQE